MLHQPVVSLTQPRLPASATPARLTNLTLLLKVSAPCQQRSQIIEDTVEHSFPVQVYLSVHHVCRNYLSSLVEGGRARTELWTRLLRRVTYPLMHMALQCVDHWCRLMEIYQQRTKILRKCTDWLTVTSFRHFIYASCSGRHVACKARKFKHFTALTLRTPMALAVSFS